MTRAVLCGAALALLSSAAGCAPHGIVEGVRYAADRDGVRSADSLTVSGRGHLRFDHALLSDLDDVLALSDLAGMQAGGTRVLESAHALAVTASAAELDRMSPAALAGLARRYGLPSVPADADARRTALKTRFAAESQRRIDSDLQVLAAAGDVATAQRFLRTIRRGVELPPGDRGKVARALLTAPLFLPATVGAEIADAEAGARVVTADFAHVVVYEPARSAAPPDLSELAGAAPATLAQWYAPEFVQQVEPAADYPAADDAFGRVVLTGSPADVGVQIDVATPVVYWAHQQAKVGNQAYDQFVYVAWYPHRPAMSPGDASAGDIDGVVVRITLDRHRRPAVYEFVRSCGCYHTLWVAEYVEAAARAQYGAPQEQHAYAVQRSDVSRELFFPALVRDDGTHPRRPTVFISAGYHLVMTIRPQQDEALPGTLDRTCTYSLEPYDALTRLPLGDGVASMFGSDGLVHHAGRAEGWLLAPTGMLSAGQPRQLGTMKIRMDAYDYDDPRLLERNLRLPSAF